MQIHQSQSVQRPLQLGAENSASPRPLSKQPLAALAPQVLACLKGWGWADDDSRHEILNVNGSGISLGHPIGATGGRILANLTREMQRRDVRYGLETMCIGGGQGIAAVFEKA